MTGTREMDASFKADRALKLHEQGLTRAQIAERLCVKPNSVKGMLERAKQRRAKMSIPEAAPNSMISARHLSNRAD